MTDQASSTAAKERFPATATPPPGIAATLTMPTTLEYHAVEDNELERLMTMQRPVLAGTFVGFLGVALGLVGPAAQAAGRLVDSDPLNNDTLGTIYIAAFCVAVAVSVVSGIVARGGKSDAQTALDAIRGRPRIMLPAGHPAAPQHSG